MIWVVRRGQGPVKLIGLDDVRLKCCSRAGLSHAVSHTWLTSPRWSAAGPPRVSDASATPEYHPSDATLLCHVTGALSSAHLTVLDLHLKSCATCRAAVSFLDRLGGYYLTPEPPATLLDTTFDRVLAKLDNAPAPSKAAAMPGVVGSLDAATAAAHFGARRMRWIAPGIRQSTLGTEPSGKLHLVDVRPGVALPHHRHEGLELTLVLRGSFADGARHYHAGDVCEVDEESDHRLVAGATDACMCLIASERRVRYSGWFARLLQPLLPF